MFISFPASKALARVSLLLVLSRVERPRRTLKILSSVMGAHRILHFVFFLVFTGRGLSTALSYLSAPRAHNGFCAVLLGDATPSVDDLPYGLIKHAFKIPLR